MEIKSVKKEKIEYPTINEISNKKLKNCIPNKWMKLGINALIFEIIMKNKAFANTLNSDFRQVLGGDITTVEDIQREIYINNINDGITIGTRILFVISFLGLIFTKIKLSKGNEEQRIKRFKNIFKILLIISVLVFVIDMGTGFLS